MKTPYTSQFADQTAAALKKLKELKEDPHWTVHSDSNGVKIWTQPAENGVAMPMTKGETSIDGVQPFDVFSVIAMPAARRVWDERFEELQVLESFGPRSARFRAKQKGGFAIAGREFVGIQSWMLEDGVYYACQYSIEDDTIPVSEGRVRGHIHLAGWIVSPSGPNSVTVTYITHADPKGTIPSAILLLVVGSTPGCVGTVKKFISTHGVPPQHFAPNPRGGIVTRDETYAADGAVYTAKLFAKEGAEKGDPFYFVLSNITYGDGAKVEVAGSTDAMELAIAAEGDPLVPGSGKAFIVTPTGIAGEVTITVSKSSGGAITLA
ncbi:hypothetical protein BJ742DRAFT_768738 [Cladochytrium replicatum]|nr:hypothetical protein BJ742DRAFT_768738 [Cladochytrium replicatum]